MNKDDIYNLDVAGIAAKDCILFLWVTFPCLPQGLHTIEQWGFEYKTLGFCWVKRNRKTPSWFWGLGFWTRSNPELCIIATKGSPKRVSKAVHCIVDVPKNFHFVDGTRIESIRSQPLLSTNKSGIRGVHFDSHAQKWRAVIYFKGKQIHLGLFEDIEDAAKARKKAEDIYYKPIIEAFDSGELKIGEEKF